jgi:hypothetical protein
MSTIDGGIDVKYLLSSLQGYGCTPPVSVDPRHGIYTTDFTLAS